MKLYVIASLIITGLLQAAYAQPIPGRQGIRGPGQERIEMMRLVKMIEELQLDSETAARVSVVHNRMMEKTRDTFEDVETLIEELDSALQRDADDLTIAGYIERIEEVRSGLYTARREALGEYRQFLTVRQMAMMMVFERNFNRDLRQILRDMQSEGRRRGRQ